MKPFSTDAERSTAHGNVPLPDCCSTLGLLGALASAATDRFVLPRPVTPCSHPVGSAPGAALSKFTVSANAALAANTVATAMHVSFMAAATRAYEIAIR